MSPEERQARVLQPSGVMPVQSGKDPYAKFPLPTLQEKAVLDVIASGEGADDAAARQAGLAGYDSVFGNGKYGRPSQPISTMTVDQVIAFQRRFRLRAPWRQPFASEETLPLDPHGR